LLAIITNAARFFIVLASKPTGLMGIPNRRDSGKPGAALSIPAGGRPASLAFPPL